MLSTGNNLLRCPNCTYIISNVNTISAVGCLTPFVPTFNFSNNQIPARYSYKPNSEIYTQQEFENSHKENSKNSKNTQVKPDENDDTIKAKKRMEILFQHYGKHHGYFD